MAEAKAGTFTGPGTTDNQSITGTGFQPSVVLSTFNARTATGTSNAACMSFGGAVSSSQRVSATVNMAHGVGTMDTAASFKSDMAGIFVNSAGTHSDIFDFVSQDSDGFTIDYLLAGTWITPYLALSDDIDSEDGKFDLNTSTGNQTVTLADSGITPKVVLLFTTIANTTEGGRANAYYTFGAADSAGNQWVTAGRDVDAAGTSDTAHLWDDTKCFAQISTSAVLAAASIVSMSAGQFVINVTTAPGASIRIGYVVLGGSALSVKVSTILQKTTTGTEAYTGVGFQPSALIFGISDALASQSGTIIANWLAGIGFATGASEQCCTFTTSDDNSLSAVTATRLSTTKCITGMTTGGSHSLIHEAELDSLDSDGFTLDWTTSDGIAREFGYVAISINPAVGAGVASSGWMWIG
jgi:hypothetical protein